MFPYSDLPGIQRRSLLRPTYFQEVEQQTPGFTAQQIATVSSAINSRLRKRYGKILPFGQMPPEVLAAGTAPPSLVLTGRPTLGSVITSLVVAAPGALGTATLLYSLDGSKPTLGPIATSGAFALPGTGMTIVAPTSPPAVFGADNVFMAAPPVPEAILRWLAWMVTEEVAARHGMNPEDPIAVRISEKARLAETQLAEAANSETGLFDLPVTEDAQSAIDTGGPRGYSEPSPYTWAYRQQQAAVGGFGGPCGRCNCVPCACPNRLVGG